MNSTKIIVEKLNEYQIPLLSISEKEQVVEELDELSEKTKELEAFFRRKIADLEELKSNTWNKLLPGSCKKVQSKT